jgi:hypothetical protein
MEIKLSDGFDVICPLELEILPSMRAVVCWWYAVQFGFFLLAADEFS